MSYTLRLFRELQLGQALDSRKLGGYFDTVISVHPLAGLFESGDSRFGPPVVTRLDDAHLFVEGRIAASRWLRLAPPLNFVLAQVRLLRLLLRMAREAGVRVVRVGDPHYLGLVGWVLARRLGVPLVVRVPSRYEAVRRATGHAIMRRLIRFCWLERRIERFVFRRCDLIAGVNEDNLRYAVECGARADATTLFRYGNLLHPAHWVEPGARPDPQRDLDELALRGTRFVAVVGRLSPEKYVEDFVRATAELHRRGLDVHGLIVGDGPLRAQLGDLARTLGAGSRIVFAGNRPQEWIARVLPAAAAILSPHMGRALVEAALSGVPLVAYDHDWQGEVVIDGETGYLVPHRDWRALADRTGALLADAARARVMGGQARARTAAMMDPEALMRHEQAAYTALLQRSSHAAALVTQP
jgi:glycosyltransferase involved in cell wall biosynthesis